MKNTIKTLLAGLLLFIPASACLHAQTNLGPASSNSVASAAATMNAAPASVSPVSVEASKSSDPNGQSGNVMALFVSFGMPVVIVGLALFFKYRKDRLTHETLRAMVEKGVPITPELIEQLNRKDPHVPRQPNRSRHLLPGLIMVAVGAALVISNHAGVGAIPGFPGGGSWIILLVGVAFLIVWLVERNDKNDAQPPRP